MNLLHRLNRLGILLLCLGVGTAHADKLDDDLQTVWESLWDQRGTPRQLVRWEGPILYRIHGQDVPRHREHIENALKAATDIAHIHIIDISSQPDAEANATLDLEIVKDSQLEDNQPCVTYPTQVYNGAFDKVQVKMRNRDAWRCTFHEMMHVMGVAGHPSGKTVLSYFPYRRDVLMDLDRLMLAAWYSPAMPKHATPLEALSVLSQAVSRQNDLDLPSEDAVKRTTAFNLRMLQQLEALVTGQGEVPTIILRSGRASHDFIRSAKPMAAYFVGMAYFRGVIARKNLAASTPWFKRGAEMGYLPAQIMWASALIDGTGVEVDRPAGHAWLTLAAKTGMASVVKFLALAEKKMSPEELEKARAFPALEVNPL